MVEKVVKSLEEMQIGEDQQEQFADIVDAGDFGGDLDDEDFEIVDQGHVNADDDQFDEVVGTLQEILMDPSFEQMQNKFSNENCMHFEATEENKLIYMDIFQRYTDTIESHLNTKLTEAIPSFSMEQFMDQLKTRKDEIEEPIMDLLLSLTEFEQFKEQMLFARAHLVATTPKIKSGKAAKLGLKSTGELKAANQEISVGDKMQTDNLKHFEGCIDMLAISGKAASVYHDEMIDGEARPDLNLLIKKV